jgi:hypothetical protein
MFRHSVITAFLGQTKDRFHVYNEPKTVDEKFAMVARNTRIGSRGDYLSL